MPKVSICENVVNVLTDLWCNGSTADFGSVSRGSSPRRSTNFETNINNKNMSWITDSNRLKHFFYAIPIGLVFTILCVLGCAAGMEFKDKQYGGKFDWLDILATMLGGLIGQIIQILIILLIYYV